MRVLFTTSEWPTHWFPMVALGWALQAGGDEVRVACAPSQAEAVTRAGLTPLPVMGGPSVLLKTRLARYWAAAAGGPYVPGSVLDPVTGEPLQRLADFDAGAYAAQHKAANLAGMRAGCDAVVDFARWWRPDLVVSDPQNVEGVLAARVLGVPAVSHLFSLVGTHETEPGLDIVLEDHSDSFARHGQPPMSAALIDHVVDHAPSSAAPAVAGSRLPMRYVPYNGPGDAPEWVERPPSSGRPRVLIAWGTSLSAIYGPSVQIAPMLISALADLDVEVVVTATEADRAQLPATLPDSVRVLDRWCPLRLVLPSCAAVVHYGSGGASLTAAQAAVPQFAVPFAPEQVMNARRLTGTGAMRMVEGPTVTPEQVRDGVAALLADPAHRTAAQAVRADMLSRPTPGAMADRLRGIAAEREPGPSGPPPAAALIPAGRP